MTHEQALSTFASERYLLDEMTEPERSTFEEHYFECTDCADDVRAGGLMRDGARAGLLGEAAAKGQVHDMTESAAWRRKAAVSRRWYQSSAIPWAAAAALTVVAGYQTLAPGRSLPGRSFSSPVALAPVTLRPASRGTEPRIPLARDSAAITLALDVSSTVSGADLPFTITSAGKVVASGRVQSPQPGVPLLLLVPSSEISAPGRYTLAIADNEYPFEVVTQ